MPENLGSWLTTTQVAERLGLATPYTYRLLCAGYLRTIKTPLGFLTDPASVDAFLAQREHAPKRGRGYALPTLSAKE